MMELGEPYRTLPFLVAVTGLRSNEALGLKWSELAYERQRTGFIRKFPHLAVAHRSKLLAMLMAGKSGSPCSWIGNAGPTKARINPESARTSMPCTNY
jgi:integrase